MASTDEKIVREFLAGWSSDIRLACDNYLADDCVWLNTGFPDFTGKKECLGLVESFHSIFPRIDAEIVNMASNEEVVFVERKDHCFDQDGHESIVSDLTGVFVVRDGKITKFHDYFDPAPFLKLMSS
jgi:limonene-1,2-epoxide hydrolase